MMRCFFTTFNYIVCFRSVCGSIQYFQGWIDTDIFSNCRLVSISVFHCCPVQLEHLVWGLGYKACILMFALVKSVCGLHSSWLTCYVKLEWKAKETLPVMPFHWGMYTFNSKDGSVEIFCLWLKISIQNE